MSRVGQYRHRVDIHVEAITGKNLDTGAPIRAWQMWKPSVPAQVLTGAGKGEVVAASAERTVSAARINMPWFPGLTTQHRVTWNGVRYDIKAIDLDETGRVELRLTCETGARHG